MNYYLTLPKPLRHFGSGDVVYVVCKAGAYLCRVIGSCMCFSPCFGRFVMLPRYLDLDSDWVHFAGFSAYKVDVSESQACVATVRGASALQTYAGLLRGCPACTGCVLDCCGRQVRADCSCSGVGLIKELRIAEQDFRSICGSVNLSADAPLLERCCAGGLGKRIADVLSRVRAGNLLITGPRGCGKATSIEFAARFLGVPLRVLSDPGDYSALDALSGFVGVVLIRKLDFVAPQRGDFATDAQNAACTALLRFMDEFKGRVAATCEDSGAVDLALRRPGRFGCELVFTALSRNERDAFLYPLASANGAILTEVDAYTLAEAAKNFTLAEMVQLAYFLAENTASGRNTIHNALCAVYHQNVYMEAFEPTCEAEIQLTKIEPTDAGRNAQSPLQRILDNFALYAHDAAACERYGVMPESVLIRGPAGAGKTALLNSATACLKPHFALFALRAHQILSMYVGESEQNLRKTFRLARYHAPSIIVIEAIDDFFGDRDALRNSSRLITTLLAEIDGAAATGGVFVIATAEGQIDAALTRFGRLGLVVYLQSRKSLANAQLDGANIVFDFDGRREKGEYVEQQAE